MLQYGTNSEKSTKSGTISKLLCFVRKYFFFTLHIVRTVLSLTFNRQILSDEVGNLGRASTILIAVFRDFPSIRSQISGLYLPLCHGNIFSKPYEIGNAENNGIIIGWLT
jgi:hypothetical protein